MTGRRIGVWDAVSLIVGIVVGATIYETPWLVFANVASAGEGLAAWALGGVLTVVGALCYAELATTWPRSGGDYVYLTRAYGPALGFLFGWAQLAALLTGSIGMLAFIFAEYAGRLVSLGPHGALIYAAGAVVVLAGVNARGLVAGKRTQNALTLIKIAGLAAIVLAGLVAAASGGATPATGAGASDGGGGFGFAMIFVLLAYGGWNDIAFVAAEVREPERNLPRALLLGAAAVTLIYLLVNVAYLAALGFEGLRASRTPAADTLGLVLGEAGARAMAALVMLAALGAVNAMTLVGARVVASVGADHRLFATLAREHPRSGAPVRALAAQVLVCLAMIAVAGTPGGVGAANALLGAFGFDPVESLGQGGFDVLLKCTAPVFWAFFLLTGVSLFVLRVREPERARPFRVPLFPLTPLVFCATCALMLRSAIEYAGALSLLGLLPVALGLPLYWLSARRS